MFNHIPKKNYGKDAYGCAKLQYPHSETEIGYMSESISTSQFFAVNR
jgi:hypothetical protein